MNFKVSRQKNKKKQKTKNKNKQNKTKNKVTEKKKQTNKTKQNKTKQNTIIFFQCRAEGVNVSQFSNIVNKLLQFLYNNNS